MRAFILLLTFFVSAVAAQAAQSTHAEILATLRSQLPDKTSASDSLLLLENIFDLALELEPRKADSIAEEIYSVALRERRYPRVLDMIRQRANMHTSDDSILALMTDRAKATPPSDDRSRTLTFLGIMRNSYNARNLPEEQRRELLNTEIKQYLTKPPSNIYEKIVLLHGVCTNLARETHGELLVDYISHLGELIDSVPDPDFVLRNVYLVQSAIDFTQAGEYAKAIEADRRLLVNIDSLESKYTRAGRPYRYFDSNRYVIYTRMLSNWPELKTAEIDKLYARAMKIRDRDVRAANTYAYSPRPTIYHAMAHKDYPTVYKLVKECIDHPKNRLYRRKLLKYLSESAAALGDDKTALSALQEYTRMLEEGIETRMEERYKELQIVYDMHEVRSQYEALATAKRDEEARMQRHIIIAGICILVLLVALIAVMLMLYRKSRRLTATLTRANNALRLDSDNLRESQAELTKARDRAEKASNFKSDFIKNISREVSVPLRAIAEYSHLIVDCTDAANSPYLQRYADLIDQNRALVDSITSDVLHMAEIDSDTLDITPQTVDLYSTVEAVVDSIKPPEGVTVAMDEDSPHTTLTTDPRRLQQILIALVANGVKFTPEGPVLVGFRPIHEGQGVEISVADTGIGIPADQAENIFGRFVKLDRDSSGAGLGLAIARMLARMLGGDVRLDTAYSGGARFLITLPVTYRKK